MVFLRVENISKKINDRYVLKNINLEVERGEILSIAGPPGSGKTTLLKIIAGLERPDEGRIFLEGEDITFLPPFKRNISMVFEVPPIYPDRTGFKNLAFPLELRGLGEEEIRKRVLEIAELLGIKHILDRKPDTYSGGEYQRVALARALVTQPKFLLLDEPLKGLDAKIREQMTIWLKQLQKKIGVTIIYTTHDPLEALTIGNRTTILLKGEIRQQGSAMDILEKPVDLEVDEYVSIPALNVFEGEISVSKNKLIVRFDDIEISLPKVKRIVVGGQEFKHEKVIVGIRPSAVRIVTDKKQEPHCRARVLLVQVLGGRKLVTLQYKNLLFRSTVPRITEIREGETVDVVFDVNNTRLYDVSSKKRLDIEFY